MLACSASAGKKLELRHRYDYRIQVFAAGQLNESAAHTADEHQPSEGESQTLVGFWASFKKQIGARFCVRNEGSAENLRRWRSKLPGKGENSDSRGSNYWLNCFNDE